MKVFISQGMHGKSDEEIKWQRECMEKEFLCTRPTSKTPEHYEFIDSFFEDYDGSALDFMAKSIALLADADIVLFDELEWHSYRGCRIEHEIATEYGLEIVYVRTDKETLDLLVKAQKTVHTVCCPVCRSNQIGFSCKAKIHHTDKVKFRLGMTCGECGSKVWNDGYFSNFEKALNHLYEECKEIECVESIYTCEEESEEGCSHQYHCKYETNR